MFDTSAIAATHGIDKADLDKSLADHGWDFSKLDESKPELLDFITRVVASRAEDIAARQATMERRRAQAAKARLARMTPLARANPQLVCGKCDGKGHLDYCRHIEDGACFWCKGDGIIRPKQKAQGILLPR